MKQPILNQNLSLSQRDRFIDDRYDSALELYADNSGNFNFGIEF